MPKAKSIKPPEDKMVEKKVEKAAETTAPEVPQEEPLDVSGMGTWERLLRIREEFYAAGAKKTGKNLHAEFKYFELEDIVPIAEPIFMKYRVVFAPTFENGLAIGRIINVDNNEGMIIFTIPIQYIAEPSKFRMNEIQAVGAMVTYYRRYLYMLVLDLVEADAFDSRKPLPEEDDAPKPAAAPKKPVSNAERKSIKAELTGAEEQADELMLAGLKAACKKLLEADPEQDGFVEELALKTENLTKISKANCEAIIAGINDMLKGYASKE